MSEIKAVLLIPEEGDPHGLLREGECGARPPTVGLWVCLVEGCGYKWVSRSRYPVPICPNCSRDERSVRGRGRALVLAWAGEPLAEGCWGANRAEWGEFCSAVDYIMHGTPEEAEELRYYVLARTAGDLVLLDAEGQEVSDE